MKRGKRTLAIVVLTTTLMSCSSQNIPAATPTVPVMPDVRATTAVSPLLGDLSLAYAEQAPSANDHANYRSRLNQLYQGDVSYIMTNHLAVDSTLWAAPIAQDGIALIAHPDVDVSQLSLDQLRSIYQGRTTSWADVGGTDQTIQVFSREDGSGTRNQFEQMVMGFRDVTRNARLAASSQQMVESISQERGSIGYVALSYVDDRVRTLAVDGVMPTIKTISEQTYPLRTTIFVVGLAEPQGVDRAFIAWVQSGEGQQVVAQRYVPLNAYLQLSG
jgi:phosphate transport system substrate-binding protein